MRTSFGIFLLLVVLSSNAIAQQPVESVQTSGTGEVRRASEVMVSPGSRNVSTRLPATVSTGDVISIQYQTAGGTLSDSFQVTGITISGDRCSIEHKHHNADDRELIDVILAQPCNKLK